MTLGRTVEELMEGGPSFLPISGREFAAWKRFYARCPFGPARGDMQAGLVCQTVEWSKGVRRPTPLSKFVIRTTGDAKAGKFGPAGASALAAALGCKVIPPEK
jgi:hypothetical protein